MSKIKHVTCLLLPYFQAGQYGVYMSKVYEQGTTSQIVVFNRVDIIHFPVDRDVGNNNNGSFTLQFSFQYFVFRRRLVVC